MHNEVILPGYSTAYIQHTATLSTNHQALENAGSLEYNGILNLLT